MTEPVTRLDSVRERLDREAASDASPPLEAYLLDEQGLADTDIANAKRFAEQHRQKVRFTPERGWLVWDGRRWAIDDKNIRVQELGKADGACDL